MSKTAIILHGTMGSPEGNWFRWLEAELTHAGYNVWLPNLPNAEKPNLKHWCDFVMSTCPFEINEDTIIIGHSSGAITALLLEQLGVSAGKYVCVSPFDKFDMGWEPSDDLFKDIDLDYAILKSLKDKITIKHSDNDPYIPNEVFARVVEGTGAQEILISGQGHFNLEQSQDYVTFPELLREI